MKRSEELEHRHDGCPNRGHCKKDESKCGYLVKGRCYLEHTDVEFFI